MNGLWVMNRDRMPLTRPSFDARELDGVAKVLDSGWVTTGAYCACFESTVAERHRVRFALATTSCTAALHIAAMALDLGPGDEVVVPAFTWVTSAHAAEFVGARTVFADVDAQTFNLSPEALAAAITPRTRAVVIVHLFGLAAPMDALLALARQHALYVIEDCACAIGTRHGGVPVGGLGDIGCFSFHPRKVITTGEGGMVTTNDETLLRRLSALRNHGATGLPADDPEAVHPWTMPLFGRLGFNYRLSDIQAAVGVAQMAKLDDILAARQARAEDYDRRLAGLDDVALPDRGLAPGDRTYQSYVIRVRDGGRRRRNRIMAHLDAAGIQTRPGTHAVPRLDYYRTRYGLAADAFPAASACEDTTITLPLYAGMTADQVHLVVDHLMAALKLGS